MLNLVVCKETARLLKVKHKNNSTLLYCYWSVHRSDKSGMINVFEQLVVCVSLSSKSSKNVAKCVRVLQE